ARSLNLKLIAAFAGAALVAVALASFLTERFTTREFDSYVTARQMMEQHMGGSTPGMGQGMEQHMEGLTPGMGQGMAQMMGPVTGQGEAVTPTAGQGEAVAPTVGQGEAAFLADVRRSLLISGGLAAAAALGVAIVIARQITGPLRRLAIAAGDIAHGKLGSRIEGAGGDEVGELARAFNGMAEALEQQEGLRRSMMADIAHELRTPLSVLRGNLEAIQDGLMEPTPQQVVILYDQSVALSRLVDDLRILSLASAGHLELHRHPIDVGELARSGVAELEAVARERGIGFSVDTDGDLPQVAVDRDRIAQALRNLLDNALRYTPQGGQVGVRVMGRGMGLVVSVVDTGSGIAPQDLPRIFDRFYRADGSRARATGGSGLGLAIVKQLIEAHGGRVWAESEQDRGSAFSFSLPS
ncbi:MAG TPA: ATP-binding protein, partial [Dehalococcoidia bacterium]|nr:ATP-binding protein [Dehalococcoidia bacterium]